MYIREWTLFCANRWRERGLVGKGKDRGEERERAIFKMGGWHRCVRETETERMSESL